MRGQFAHLPHVFTPFLHSVHWIWMNSVHHFFHAGPLRYLVR